MGLKKQASYKVVSHNKTNPSQALCKKQRKYDFCFGNFFLFLISHDIYIQCGANCFNINPFLFNDDIKYSFNSIISNKGTPNIKLGTS